MDIGLVGLNYRSAPLSLREKVAAYFTVDEINRIKYEAGVLEGALLSTCNRTEVIFSARHEYFPQVEKAILESFSRSISINGDQINEHILRSDNYIYQMQGLEVPTHVYKVATGLDSMILGETQIFSQIKKSYASAVQNGWIGATLHRLFQSAFHAAKRIRSSTGIGRGTLSVAYAARQAVKGVFGDLAARKVLVIGAGDTANLICKHLHDEGCRTFFIANRTLSRANQLAESVKGISIPLTQVTQIIPMVDIVVTAVDGMPVSESAASPDNNYIVTRSMIDAAIANDVYKNICLLDLSVPRAIDPSIENIESAYLFDIDDFGDLIANNLEARTLEAERANQIIEEESQKFIRWQAERETRITLSRISDELLSYGREEISKLYPKLAELVEDDQAEESIQNLILSKQRNAIRRFLHPYYNKLELPEFFVSEEMKP